MIESVCLATVQKSVLGQQSNKLIKKEWKEGIQIYLGFKVKSYCSFSPRTKNFSLTLCQSSKHLQDTVSTKLLGQFIELYNTQLFKKIIKFDLRLYCSLFLYATFSTYEKLGVNLTCESFYMEKKCGLKKHTDIDIYKMYKYIYIYIYIYILKTLFLVRKCIGFTTDVIWVNKKVCSVTSKPNQSSSRHILSLKDSSVLLTTEW